MLRYLPGLLFLQVLTLLLFGLNADAPREALLLRAGLPALAITLITALWFRSLSRADGERDLARSRLEHEREREALHRQAAAERVEVERSAARTIRREERRAGRRASLKVGLAFAATAAMGVLFVLSELVTLGLITLTTGGGAMGGYWLRWRQTRTLALTARGASDPDRAVARYGGGSPATNAATRPATRPATGSAVEPDADFTDEALPAPGAEPADGRLVERHADAKDARSGVSGASGSLRRLPRSGSAPGRAR